MSDTNMRDTIAESLNKITDSLGGLAPTVQDHGRGEVKRPARAKPVDQTVRTGTVLVVDDSEHPGLLVWTRNAGESWREAWIMDDGDTRIDVQTMVQGMGYFARATVRKVGERLVIDSQD